MSGYVFCFAGLIFRIVVGFQIVPGLRLVIPCWGIQKFQARNMTLNVRFRAKSIQEHRIGREFFSFNSSLIVLFTVDPEIVDKIVVCLHRVRAATMLYLEIR